MNGKPFILILLAFSLYANNVLTVEDAVKIGLNNNFDILIAKNNAKVSKNNIGKGTAGFLPLLNASGGASKLKSEQDTNSPFSFGSSETKSYSASITLNWTIFDGFRMFINKNKYNNLAQLGFQEARSQIETAVVSIMSAYFNVVKQKQLLEIAENNLAISKSRLEKEKLRGDIGGMSSTDYLNAKVVYNNDLSARINQELQVEIAVKNLNLALGRDPQEQVETQKDIDIDILQLEYEDLLQLALDNNSNILIVKKNKAVAQNDIGMMKSQFYPVISLNGSAIYGDRLISGTSRGDITTTSRDYQGALQLSWNLFNGMRNTIDLQNAKIREKNAELNYKKMQNLIAGLLKEKYDTYKKRLRLMMLEKENVKAAERNLQRQQERYDLGAATSLDFRDAQTKLVRAQANYVNSKYLTKISRLEIDQLIGRIRIK